MRSILKGELFQPVADAASLFDQQGADLLSAEGEPPNGLIFWPLKVLCGEIESSQRCADEPDLPAAVLFAQPLDMFARKLHRALVKEIGDLFAGAGKDVLGGRVGGENGNVALQQVAALGGNQAQQVLIVFNAGPKAVEQSVEVERIAHVIRMKAVGKQYSVPARGSGDDPDLIVNEAFKRAIIGEQ